MTIKNKEKIYNFLDEHYKKTYYDIDAIIDDIIKQYCESEYKENGYYEYELSRFESNDGNPHILEYEVEEVIDEDGEIIDEILIF